MLFQLEKSLDFFCFDRKIPVACLVSGGIDSMVLLDLLARRQKTVASGVATFFPLTVIHFNHHLRGAESDRDETFVRAEAEKREIPVIVKHLPVAKGSGIQNRARKMRLEAIKKIADETACRPVAGCRHFFLAHQADDQVETVLMKYLRGAGIRGLKGMERESRHTENIVLVRPLLDVPRYRIEAYAKKKGVSFVQDSSNRTGKYWRNRIRKNLVPELKKNHPGLIAEITEKCRQLQEEYRLIRTEADSFLSKFQDSISVGRFFTISPSARFLVIEDRLRHAGFDKEVQKHHIEEIEGLLMKGKRVKREYGNAVLRVDEGFFEFVPER